MEGSLSEVGTTPPHNFDMPHTLFGGYTHTHTHTHTHIYTHTSTTRYSVSINPYHNKKNGRDAFLAHVSQYEGEDKRQKLLKDISEILHNQRWSYQGTFTLYKFISVHHKSYVMMTQCAEHVDYQLPTKFTCVNLLLGAIKYK